jgi:glutamate N-acetyltransferase/amino-acid N-acetyltransferase
MKQKSKIIIPGFLFSGIYSGIKESSRLKDLSLIYSTEESTLIDGVFTQNKVVAAPVELCQKVVKKGLARLVVVNSGVANACTGKTGEKDALTTQKEASKLFNLPQNQVCVSSTGKIGDFLPMKKLISGIKKSKDKLSENSFSEACEGIMTTDQYPKFASVKGKINGKPYTIAVLAKGAGMLRPDMATMLAYVVTDLKFSKKALRSIFREAVNLTLNRITVDGDTSTNDTVLILANGKANNKNFTAQSPTGQKIKKQITELLENMAHQITLDGEGATKCCRVNIKGAKSKADASKIAYAIGNSPLVKTALFGCDPNWGRIVAAIGYSKADINANDIEVKLGKTLLYKNGSGIKNLPVKKLISYMKNKHIEINAKVGKGKGEFYVFMSDLTYDYVTLNAEYHT